MPLWLMYSSCNQASFSTTWLLLLSENKEQLTAWLWAAIVGTVDVTNTGVLLWTCCFRLDNILMTELNSCGTPGYKDFISLLLPSHTLCLCLLKKCRTLQSSKCVLMSEQSWISWLRGALKWWFKWNLPTRRCAEADCGVRRSWGGTGGWITKSLVSVNLLFLWVHSEHHTGSAAD